MTKIEPRDGEQLRLTKCPRCAYLIGNVGMERCPECGTEVVWMAVRRQARGLGRPVVWLALGCVVSAAGSFALLTASVFPR